MPSAPPRAEAQHDVAERGCDHDDPERLQTECAQREGIRQWHLPGCERDSGEQQPARPVRDQGERDHVADLRRAQAEPVIQAQAEPKASDERAEVQVERIADEADADHAPGGEPVPGVGAAEQIVRRIRQVAQRGQRGGGAKRQRRVGVERAANLAPVDRLHVLGNQPGDEQQECEPDRRPEKRPPARHASAP